MSDKVIVTAAITGAIHTPFMSDYLPITPEHIIEEVVRVYNAGGAVAHVHVRDPKTGQPVSDMELFRHILTEVKKRCPIIICTTTGGGLGMSADQRVKVVPTFKPELASFNAGSMNFALFQILDNKKKPSKFDWEDKYLATFEIMFDDLSWKAQIRLCETFNTHPIMENWETQPLAFVYREMD